jgi:hypothetical protein
MSTHFTYEIDERKLRVKLKELEPVVNPEAWQSFEAYTNAQTKSSGHNSFKNFQVPINRTVIVPVVFGILIIFFSVLLFNFISIRGTNPEEKNTVTEIKSSDSEVKPQVATSPTSPAIAEKTATSLPSETKNNLNKVTTTASLSSNGQMSVTSIPAQKPVQQGQSVTSATLQTAVKVNSTGTNTSMAATPTVLSSEVSSNQTTKKKGKRRTAEVIESDSSNDSRPNLGGDERETEVRPN